MPVFTVFTLAGPFASFGVLAGNERRGTTDRPGHSMLVGLVAAALGIRRDEGERLAALSDASRFAVRADDPGTLLVDYHTVQSAKRRRNFAPETRRDMLAGGDIVTMITKREYLTDVRFTVALALEGGAFEHDAVVEALRRPRFTLYLGRKSCPPGLPLDPLTLQADEAGAAFATYDGQCRSRASGFWPARRPRSESPPTVAADARLAPDASGRRETRRTRPRDRNVWTFDLLDELVLAPARPRHAADTAVDDE